MSSSPVLEEVSVHGLMERYNLIVPEIQREYVWGYNYHNILDTFFKDIKQGRATGNILSNAAIEALTWLNSGPEGVTEQVKAFLQTALNNVPATPSQINIGFLYSYRPDYYVFNDRNDDIYLIDGQQRFTTLFVMLFYFAVKENRLDEFLSSFRFDEDRERIAFDYRVRSLTHNFFIDLISQTTTLDDLKEIVKKSWFLANYGDDPTINAVVYGLLPRLLKSFEQDGERYYDFVKHEIKFWHFKTEETSQGEELYITMNSRGQQLADNENLRAALFEADSLRKAGEDVRYWSERWEIWQDFFWVHRDVKFNSSADAGFNEFLRWVQICHMTERQRVIIDDENEEAADKKPILKAMQWDEGAEFDLEFLTLPVINAYFNAIEYMYEQFPLELRPFQNGFKLYRAFDLLERGWLSPEVATIAQRDLFRLLPPLQYVKQCLEKNKNVDPSSLFRVIRFFYNLSKNENVSKSAGLQTINALKIVAKLNGEGDISDQLNVKGNSATIFNSEEKRKLNILVTHPKRSNVEDQFWFAEDFKYSNGEISFLIDWSLMHNKGEFKLPSFTRMFASYVYIIENENAVRGDLMITEVFDEPGDRVTWNDNFYKTTDFLSFVYRWHKFEPKILNTYLIRRRKAFIQRYKTVEELKAESRVKNQLYVYYIINENILKPNPHWRWNDGYNIGIFTHIGEAKSIFDKKYIFQFFRRHFRENYDKVCWIQRSVNLGPAKLNMLLDWSAS